MQFTWKIFPLVLRVGLGVIFFWSGLEKVWHLSAFYQDAQNYHVLSPLLTQIYSASLPWFEILAGGLLLLGLFSRFATLLMSLLLASFIIAVSLVLMKGGHADCGCFLGGAESSPITAGLLFRDIALMMGVAYLCWANPKSYSLDAWFQTES